MNIIFAGTPEFSVSTLAALCASEHKVIAVYTQPDKVSGRGQHLSTSPVKQYALSQNIPVVQPVSLKTADDQAYFASLKADVMVVVAYGLILPQAVLDMPSLGCINVHASLLPRWRGASPIQQAILSGDQETGVSIMQMEAGLDTGPVLMKSRCAILPTDTAGVLHDRLAHLGAEALLQVLVENKQPEKQADLDASYAGKITKQAGLIHWHDTAINIERKVRAFNPWPIAYFYIDNLYVRVWQGELTPDTHTSAPGTILAVSAHGITIAAGDHTQFRITQLQMANGKVLSVQAYLNAGHAVFVEGKCIL